MSRTARPKQIVIGAMNIVASPHPPGVYTRLLIRAADREIEVWGSDWAKITKPRVRKLDKNVLVGEILLWTKVDRKGSWIDKETNAEATLERKRDINIPDPLEPNFRTFYYGFLINEHRLVYEMKNSEGQHFSSTRAEKFFRELFSRQILGTNSPEVNVTSIPEDDTIYKMLRIPKLRRLEITLYKPNPDDMEDETAKLLEELENQGAKKQTLILNKAPKVPSLVPNERTRTLAIVASENGFVKAKGADIEGNPVDESTKEHPKSIAVDVRADQSSRYKFIEAISRFIQIVEQRPQKL